ncbi:hypothetical protein FA743_19400 [Paracoccus gahaiensis]|uniref:Uncharacterized protein n=1 Tax=Paracoccus gahaiensis TaxID=1706839 RepID=A0A4U0R2W4_9RHOB|nr:hypothetical protein [Paracoccus gahaiensis]TJZ89037.1 hypothetical protein FA743_19400 [Paracoccus gahaiensis]
MAELLAPEQGLLLLDCFAGIALGGHQLAAGYQHMILVLKECTRLPGALVAAGKNSLSVYGVDGVVAGFLFGCHSVGLFRFA